jgi:outer membrane protein TolC
MVYWQGKIDEYQLRLETAEDRLNYQEKELLHRLGFPGAESLIVRNLPDWFSDGAIPGLMASPSSFMRAWELRGDARAAELDLFVSAMGIEAAHRKGWPRPFFRVGVGNNDLLSSNDVVPAVIEAGVTMPLIDFGENKRMVRNAETLRNLKQKKIEALLRQIHGDLDLAALESSQIQSRLEAANSRLQSLESLREETRGLVTTGHLDATEEIRLGIAVGEAQLKVEALIDNLKKVHLRQCALTSLPVRAGLRDSIADALLGSSHQEPTP